MSEPFLAQVQIFAGNFAPRGWAFCDGTLLPIAQNTALFSLIGTTYGGDGRTTTALPDLRGRAPMHPGRGPGLTSRRLGEKGGTETVTLTQVDQIGSHSHSAMGSTNPANQKVTAGHVVAAFGGRGASIYQNTTGSNTGAFRELGNTGGGGAHNNMQPFLTLNYIIALTGLYPSRS